MRFQFCLLLILFLLPLAVTAQKQTANWHFGRNKGLRFTTSPPAITGSALNTLEGSAAISDKKGNLLFYTDGRDVWDRMHKKMPNGYDLKGHWTSTQSALIIPKPGNEHIYYLFTADEGGYQEHVNRGIYYSEVNMCLNDGLGDIVSSSKNTFLYKYATERLAAVYHQNGTDIWLMTHERDSDRFVAYLITENGIEPSPVVSSIGIDYSLYGFYLTNTIGEMKFSPDGKKLAVAIAGRNTAQVFNFDAATGQLSNEITLSFQATFSDHRLTNAYGLSFSASSKILYVTAAVDSEVNQYNLEAGDEQAIRASRYSVVIDDAYVYGLQLGMDNKIYVNRSSPEGYIGVIHEPDKMGETCRYQGNYIKIGKDPDNNPGVCFPNFISSYFSSHPYITYQTSCKDQTTSFALQNATAVEAIEWIFGDEKSENNSSTDFSPIHQFSNAGNYQVQAKISLADGTIQTIEKKVIVSSLSDFTLGKDTTLCPGDSLVLDVSSYAGAYRWQDRSTNANFTVKAPGVYWVEICTNNCSLTDSIVVNYSKPLAINLGEDRIICEDNPVELTAYFEDASYKWQDGSTKSSFQATKTGTYHVVVSGKCEQASDSAQLLFERAPVVELGEDLSACVGDTIFLNAFSIDAKQYRWYEATTKDKTAANSSSIAITTQGEYIVEAQSENCIVRDTITITFIECEQNLFIPNVITPNGDGANDTFFIKGILEGTWTIHIYNRQGKIIYENNAYRNNWDGGAMSSGQYYYLLYNSKSKRTYKGWIQVLR